MIKKTTAIAAIMLASIILLAHAVVPHHHHNKQVCLINTHCINDDITDEHGTTKKSHSHDGENNSDNCVLKESVVILSNQCRTDLKFNNNTSDRSGLYAFHYNLLNSSTEYSSTEFLIPVLSSFIYERYTDSSYSSLISASLGLRAPPVV